MFHHSSFIVHHPLDGYATRHRVVLTPSTIISICCIIQLLSLCLCSYLQIGSTCIFTLVGSITSTYVLNYTTLVPFFVKVELFLGQLLTPGIYSVLAELISCPLTLLFGQSFEHTSIFIESQKCTSRLEKWLKYE